MQGSATHLFPFERFNAGQSQADGPRVFTGRIAIYFGDADFLTATKSIASRRISHSRSATNPPARWPRWGGTTGKKMIVAKALP
jgi:hypothetical protein